MSDTMQAGTVTISGAGGDQIEAYAATPVDRGQVGGVVVIHHMPGYDEATKEITRRFAAWGYAAVCPNLHHREAPGASSDDAAAASRAAGGVPDERLVGDVTGSAEYLRSLPSANGKVATIGFCSGGRQSVLAACSTPIDAAVACYPGMVLFPPPEGSGLRMTSLRERLPDMRCPLLGLFGADDQHPSPDEVVELDRLLSAQGQEHEFHSFEGAGHAFFAVDRPSYRPAAAVEGWGYVRDFLGRHLGTPGV